MSRVFVVNVESPEIRVAEVRDGRLFDLDIERDARMLGNIYKGRVENIVPGMDAAFVDMGERRNALLYVGDVAGSERGAPISSLLKTRQEILVQVARPPVGNKGARVTTRLSLPGRYAILVAGSETVGVSKRIPSDEERGRLRKLAERLRPFDHGIIIRTEAEGVSESLLSADISSLSHQLSALVSRGKNVVAPLLIHEDLGILGRIARDRIGDDVSAIIIDSRSRMELLCAQLRAYAPQLAQRVQFYGESTPIFEKFGIAQDVENAAKRQVSLPNGGSIVVDEAEALTAIDVNTGSFTGRKGLNETVITTNLEAVAEIARQLRLRDLGGMIVVDFIDMERTRDRVKILNAFEAALKDDRGRSRIVQISPSGLIEMTRRREGQSLLKQLNDPCPHCNGTGFLPKGESLAIAARRRAREMMLENPAMAVLVRAHPETACDFLGEDGEWAKALERETGGVLRVSADENLERAHVHFERLVPHLLLQSDLVVGALVPFPVNSPLYPTQEPQFGVVGQTLVAFDKLPENGVLDTANSSILLKITEVGRHFSRAKTVN